MLIAVYIWKTAVNQTQYWMKIQSPGKCSWKAGQPLGRLNGKYAKLEGMHWDFVMKYCLGNIIRGTPVVKTPLHTWKPEACSPHPPAAGDFAARVWWKGSGPQALQPGIGFLHATYTPEKPLPASRWGFLACLASPASERLPDIQLQVAFSTAVHSIDSDKGTSLERGWCADYLLQLLIKKRHKFTSGASPPKRVQWRNQKSVSLCANQGLLCWCRSMHRHV